MCNTEKNTISKLKQNAEELPLLMPDKECWQAIQQRITDEKRPIKANKRYLAFAASIIVAMVMTFAFNLSYSEHSHSLVAISHQTEQVISQDIYWRVREIDQQLSQTLNVDYRKKLWLERSTLLKQNTKQKNTHLTII